MIRTPKTQEEFDGLFSENKRYCILGFPKCGTTALKNHIMNRLNRACFNLEIAYSKTGTNKWFSNDYFYAVPIIIFRNPIERTWSAYNFFRYFSDKLKLSFEEFLDYKNPVHQGIGCNDPLACCDYEKYIAKWEKVIDREKLIVLRFEDIIKFMEKRNITKQKPKMPQEYRNLVLEKMQEKKISIL